MSIVSVIPLEGIPELEPSDDLGLLLHGAAVQVGGMEAGDVVVVAQKAVSKVEGRVVALVDVEPSDRAIELAGPEGDPRHLEVILRESAEVVRSRPPLVIAETRHGFVCASAGVDASRPRTIAAGIALALPITSSAAPATSSATAICVVLSSRPRLSRDPRRSWSGASPATPSATSVVP